MNTFSSIIAGFGGQGSLLMGKIMAYSGMLEGKEVSWCPSYGPKMRGGTANVNVIISDEGIGSPVITKDADCIVALNQAFFGQICTSCKRWWFFGYQCRLVFCGTLECERRRKSSGSTCQ